MYFSRVRIRMHISKYTNAYNSFDCWLLNSAATMLCEGFQTLFLYDRRERAKHSSKLESFFCIAPLWIMSFLLASFPSVLSLLFTSTSPIKNFLHERNFSSSYKQVDVSYCIVVCFCNEEKD